MSPPKILLVDDDPDWIEALRRVIDGAGHDCVHALSGARALEILPREKPDLMILGIGMDDIAEGFRVVYKLRKPEAGLEACQKIPIVVLSGIAQGTGMKFDPSTDSDYLPVDEFLEKPVQPAVLLEKVRALLGRRAAG
jgi:CheY-like chemotaxis protein